MLSALVAQFAGCADPEYVRTQSDYDICVYVIAPPPLAPDENIKEGQRQARYRNLDCSKYAAAIIQQSNNLNNALVQMGQQQQQQQIRTPVQTTCVRNGAFTNCTSY